MHYLWRSLRYLKPYKARLAISIVCVLFIAVLWSGGLGTLIPAMKILLDREGLHGWAWRSAADNRLGATVSQREVAATQVRVKVGGKYEEQTLRTTVLDVIAVDKDSPAARAGIVKGDWLIGAADLPVMGADDLAQRLAEAEAGSRVSLQVYPHSFSRVAPNRLPPPADVQVAALSPKSRALVMAASRVRKPDDFKGRFPMFLWVLAAGLAMTLLRNVLRFFQDYFVQTATWRATLDLRCENYNIALRLPVTFYSSKGSTDTMSRFIQDTNTIRRGQETLFGKTLVEPAKAVGSVIMAFAISWQFTLIAMLAGPPVAMLIHKFGGKMKRASRKALENWSKMLAVLEETLVGIRVVKAYTMEAAERKRFFRINRKLLKEQDRMSRVDAATAPSVETMGMAGGLIAAGIAGYLVFSGRMNPTDFLAWLIFLVAMFDPVRKLADVSNRFHESDAAAKRVFEVTDEPQEKRTPKAPLLPPHARDIEFRGVGFRYPEASGEALRDVHLTIQAGERVAIVGPNGSGKTTLVSLLPRLIDPTTGAVFIDGQDLSGVSLRSLRRQIAVVTQDAVLFNATIGENISYGLRRPTPGAVLAASKKAYVDEFVRDLPDGYDTMVGEHGATLSGGQKQRITIARAILRNPRILIFDEAMSQIDADSERKIHQAMEEFIQGRTTLMIAHRFATVLSADRIVVMEAGRIIDAGTHEELLERCQVYSHLYRTQFVDTGGK